MNQATLFKSTPITKLHESPDNPRKRFDKTALDELTESIKVMGVLTPLIVRPCGEGFEIGAGHRRFRAAKDAGLKEVPCIIRALSDEEFLELLVIENDQREDVHPLEEAKGYFTLSRRPGYDISKIASRIGRSEKYVYDRLKLLSLTKEAQELFLSDKFTAGHAILLARLSPSQQKAAMEDDGGLFQHEYVNDDLFLDAQEREAHDVVKPRSVREFQCWINDHVRFDRSDPDPMLFPETTKIIQDAKEKAEKIVPITEEHYVQTSARSNERTIGPRSWARADGKSGSKTCAHSVTGVIVVGPGRGQAFKVCTAKETCKVHWGQWQKEREQRAKQSSSPASQKEKERLQKAEQQRQEAERKNEERRARWMKALPVIRKTLADTIKKTPTDAKSFLSEVVLSEVRGYHRIEKNSLIPRGKTAEDFIRYASYIALCNDLDNYRSPDEFPKTAKKLGLDIWRVINETQPEQKKPVKKK